MRSVLVVNTSRADVVDRLESDPSTRFTVITEPPYVDQYRAGTDVRLVPDVNDLKSVHASAIEVLREHGLTGVVAASERSLRAGGFLRSSFGLPGPGFDVSVAFSDKIAMKGALVAAGLPVAPFRAAAGPDEVARAADDVGWPVIVKPAIGTGSIGAVVARSPEELARRLGAGPRPDPGRLIVERFVDVLDEYHCDAVVHSGRTRFAAVSRYLAPRLGNLDGMGGSCTLRGDDPTHDEVSDLHDRVVAALGLRDGVTHLELFRTPRGFLVGEITCRPGGGGIVEHIAFRFGLDLWDALIRVSTGQAPAPAGPEPSGCTAYCQLPMRFGRVVAITPASELRLLPGVDHAEVRYAPGDVLRGILHSSVHSGLVFLTGRTPDELLSRIDLVAKTYRLHVEPDGGSEDR